MCDVVEEYVNKKIREDGLKIAENFLRNGASVEVVAESMPYLTYEEVASISKQISEGRL
jgi:hypothetical protein